MAYRGMSVAGLLQSRPMDMSSILMRPEGSLRSQVSCKYGAGAIETSNARILEEVKARHQARADRYISVGTKGCIQENIQATDEELSDTRRRRQALEARVQELKAAESRLEQKKGDLATKYKNILDPKKNTTEKERKREAAFARRREEMGAKPAGVRKVVSAAGPAKFHVIRPTRRGDKYT